MYKGIDYGLGKTNIDEHGIRNGVIPQHAVGSVWYEESEPYYGKPTCPRCGTDGIIELPNENIRNEFGELITLNEIHQWEYDKYSCDDFCCIDCKYVFGYESAYPEEPYSFFYEQYGYSAECSDAIDIFVCRSPYYTYAQFCSPCAPGACYLLNPLNEKDENNKCYCFGHDWFENGKAQYPVYSVKTNKLIEV